MPDREHHCDHSERVVALEVQVKEIKDDLDEILKELKEVNGQLTKYKGFIGGITFIVGGIPVIWTLGKDWFLRHWS